MLHVIDARPALTAAHMCSMVLPGECGDPDPVFEFSVNVSPGPAITQSKSASTPRNPNELRILHITDPHYDRRLFFLSYQKINFTFFQL
jgi:hypothetical protein